MRIELRERIGDRDPETVATASLREDGTVEIVGEPTSVEFLSLFRVCPAGSDDWVSKDESPSLWLELIPQFISTPHRWAERVD